MAGSDVEAVAKYWYTEQRGRVVGNTRPWDDLTKDQRANLVEDVEEVLETMRRTWKW